ncbi:hypothetical protein [Amycolatopsis sp. NPDC059657]|uniref:hypothetical protein n=1 Tax=Amycolatopsis sp. NPDC059657 TaxID=3346899 RepID=UPI003671B71C
MMSTEPTDQPEPAGWGDTPPPAPAAQKKWSGRKTAVAVGVAVVIAAGGGVAIAVGTSGNADNAAGQGGPGGGRMIFGPGGPGTGGGIPRDALRGNFVVPDANGGYTTERLQTGTVSELSATSITLTSKDNYKQTYTIDATTKKTSEPKNGDTVTVTAKVDGATATATTIGTPGQMTRGGNGGRRQGY